MSDTPPPDTGTEATAQTPPDAPSAPQSDDTSPETLKAEVEKWKAQARKHEERAKANAAAAKELEQVRLSSMSEQEQAVEKARIEARAEAIAEVNAQLVDARLEAAAAGRLAPEQLAALLTGINRASFLNDDGTVNGDAISAFVDGIAPASGTSFPDLGQGARTGGAMALNGDPIERALRDKLGIR